MVNIFAVNKRIQSVELESRKKILYFIRYLLFFFLFLFC